MSTYEYRCRWRRWGLTSPITCSRSIMDRVQPSMDMHGVSFLSSRRYTGISPWRRPSLLDVRWIQDWRRHCQQKRNQKLKVSLKNQKDKEVCYGLNSTLSGVSDELVGLHQDSASVSLARSFFKVFVSCKRVFSPRSCAQTVWGSYGVSGAPRPGGGLIRYLRFEIKKEVTNSLIKGSMNAKRDRRAPENWQPVYSAFTVKSELLGLLSLVYIYQPLGAMTPKV
jgi:hypothetical protein